MMMMMKWFNMPKVFNDVWVIEKGKGTTVTGVCQNDCRVESLGKINVFQLKV